jgi:hypothetical protein
MRYNTIGKRKAVRNEMIRYLIAQGYMYNNSAQDATDKWIENGLASFPAKSYVKESVRMGMVYITYSKKKKRIMWL